MLYILSTIAVPIDFSQYTEATIKMEKVNVEELRNLLSNNQYISAIGHESTAKLLSQLLGINIQANRIEVSMHEGDIGIHFVLAKRLGEGQILNYEDLSKIEYNLVLSRVLSLKSLRAR